MELTQVGMLVVLVIAVTEAIKKAGVNSRYIPLVALALSIGASLALDGISWLSTASGVILGLTSSGLFSVVKKVVLNK